MSMSAALIHSVRRVADAPWFHWGITGCIGANALVIGLDTSVFLATRYGAWFHAANQVFLGIFVLEAAIKIAAEPA